MEIVFMGMFCFVLIVYLGARKYADKIVIDQLRSKLKKAADVDWDYVNMVLERADHIQRELETERSKVRCLLGQRKQLQSDITCFRAELGLGPRLYDNSEIFTMPHFGLPMVPRPESVKFTIERGCDD